MRFILYLLVPVLFLSCDDSDEITTIGDALSAQEIEDLQFLREEEKLARDVYLYSYDLYGQSIFKNISNSEQSHMDNVSVLMKKYNISDISSSERGKFSNETLQNLYTDLTALVDKSIEDALLVGATIEDLDINDLDHFILNTSHQDIEEMYDLLNCGSRNHMRAYTNNLNNLGVEYTPQFITLEAYNAIINSSNEKCGN